MTIETAAVLARFEPALTKLAMSVAEPMKGKASKKIDELKVVFRVGFNHYMRHQVERYSKVKTIIGSSIPLELKDIYVNLRVKQERGAPIRDEDFLDLSFSRGAVIFTATAGAGKSMLMRYLYLLYLQEQSERLPVFLNLRDTNDFPDISIMEFIRDTINTFIKEFSLAQLEFAFKDGMIALFLDGFDEVDYEKRSRRSNEINTLASIYTKCRIFVSGRPDPSFFSWEVFNVYKICDFSLNQAKVLIDKLPYDEDSKRHFIGRLDIDFYEENKEFLVNPLLIIIMLITFEQFADAPAKMHLFYEYAFDALFVRHDSMKGGWKRKRHVDLPLDDYRVLFSYFCVISYTREIFTFTQARALETIDASIKCSQIDVSKVDMFHDLIECTCMLVRDGLDYVFSHRSFQEYFVAFFFSRVKIEQFALASSKLIQRGPADNVLLMLSEMNREKFEESWALPRLNELCELVERIDLEHDLMRFVNFLFGSRVSMLIERRHYVVQFSRCTPYVSEEDSVYQFLRRIYSGYKIEFNGVCDVEFVDNVMKNMLLKGDSRFDTFRSDMSMGHGATILLKADDSIWLKETKVAAELALVRDRLLYLRSSVKTRVQKRNEGLASIITYTS